MGIKKFFAISDDDLQSIEYLMLLVSGGRKLSTTERVVAARLYSQISNQRVRADDEGKFFMIGAADLAQVRYLLLTAERGRTLQEEERAVNGRLEDWLDQLENNEELPDALETLANVTETLADLFYEPEGSKPTAGLVEDAIEQARHLIEMTQKANRGAGQTAGRVP